MNEFDKYKDIPDRRPEIYTAGMDGVDHPIESIPERVTKKESNLLLELPLIRSATHEARITAMMIVPKGEPIFHEGVTEVAITDEAAGEFVRIKQFRTDRTGAIEVDGFEWPVVSEVIEYMLGQCRKNDG